MLIQDFYLKFLAACMLLLTAFDVTGNKPFPVEIPLRAQVSPPAAIHSQPSIQCPNDIVVPCADQAPSVDISVLNASDFCGGVVTKSHVGDVLSGVNCANQFVIMRSYMATDTCGNSATCVQRIEVNDRLLPDITCPQDLLLSCAGEVPAMDIEAVTVSDNCAGTVTKTHLQDSLAFPNCVNQFLLIRVFQATDACGNIATCAQRINVDADSLPSIICPPAITVSCVSDIPAVDVSAVQASDLCGGTATVMYVSGFISDYTCSDQYRISRIYLATDACSNTAKCTQEIVVFDQQAPNLTCPPNITVSCDEQLPSIDVSPIITTDNCGGNIKRAFVGEVTLDKTCLNRYRKIRTYQVTDACGNKATCTQNVVVHDGVAPTIICPPAVTADCPPGIDPDLFTVYTADNCGSLTPKTYEGDKVTATLPGDWYVLTRTYQAMDACGQTNTCTQKINLRDAEPPTIQCPANLTVACPEEAPPADANSLPVSDNCNGPIKTTLAGEVISNQICGNRFLLTRTYQVKDLVGHTATCTQQILVNDQTPPTISCPPNTTVSCANTALMVDLNAVSASDNCTGLVKSHVNDLITNKICNNNFVLTRTFKVADGCGYTATCTSRIRVLNQPPPAVCPPNTTVSCAADVPAAAAVLFVFYDNCSDSINQVKWLSDAISNKTCANRYLITRTYRITDGCGSSAQCSQKINVSDQTGPALICPANVLVSCSAQIPAATPGAIVALDNCASGSALPITFSEAQVNTSCNNRFQIIRTYKATDLCGNEGSCVQQIEVDDQTPPTIKCPANTTVACATQVPPLMPVMISASDNCIGSLNRFFLGDFKDAEICTNNFRINRVYAAADLCGNSASCTQIITVLDQKPPTITCPANLTVSSTAAVPAPNVTAIPAVGDNCSSGVVKSHLADLVSNLVCAEQYLLTRVYQAADACGNTSTCQQQITVDDRKAPTGQCPTLLPVACAADIPCDSADPDLQAFLQQVGTFYSDNSGVPVQVEVDSMLPIQDCTAGNNSYGRTIQYTISDACGNKTPCTVRYAGDCFCTYTQDFWGDAASKVEGQDITFVIDSLLKSGWITLGSHGSCGYTFSTAPCIFKALPAGNEVTPFISGNVPGCSGPWDNAVAGQLLALQLNIRYNQAYRGLNLGAMPLSGSCLLDSAAVKQLGLPGNPTVEHLVAQANGYLTSLCFGDTTYKAGSGEKLLAAMRTLNEYWKDCGKDVLCNSGSFASPDPQDRNDPHTRAYEGLETMRLMPNPVQDMLHVEFTTETATQAFFRVFDAAGKQVLRRTVETGEGRQSVDLDVAGLRPGVYWLSWAGGANLVTRRFVVFRG